MSESRSRVAGWVWIFTPLTVLGFVGFLYYLSEIPTNDDEIIVQQPSIEKEEILKPILTEDQFEFYQLLENEKVEPPTEVPKVAKPRSSGEDKQTDNYYKQLQAGSFSNPQDADQLKAQLLLLGLEVRIEAAEVKGKTWHRIYVGPYDNLNDLELAREQLTQVDIAPIVVSAKR